MRRNLISRTNKKINFPEAPLTPSMDMAQGRTLTFKVDRVNMIVITNNDFLVQADCSIGTPTENEMCN